MRSDGDAHRAGERSSKRLPPVGIAGTFKRLQPPGPEEGFDELYRVDASSGGLESLLGP
jgi:hypothetical protein